MFEMKVLRSVQSEIVNQISASGDFVAHARYHGGYSEERIKDAETTITEYQAYLSVVRDLLDGFQVDLDPELHDMFVEHKDSIRESEEYEFMNKLGGCVPSRAFTKETESPPLLVEGLDDLPF